MEYVTDLQRRREAFCRFLDSEITDLYRAIREEVAPKLRTLFRRALDEIEAESASLEGFSGKLEFSGPVDVVAEDADGRYYVGLLIIHEHHEHVFAVVLRMGNGTGSAEMGHEHSLAKLLNP
ncbi:hypothetical protein MYX78_00760 [Acidobacteria bacterium AH-259-G07]|nr:hypothetical protein [Acidobacteria bacterium AH-259-G07]